MTTTLADKARQFTALHIKGDPILLPNAWDAASAFLIARAGAKAIATSSASCAWSLGRHDGGGMSREDAIAAIARIASAVDVPVSADIETGYGDGDGLAATVEAVLDAGAIGINLEDSGGDPLYPIDVAAARVALARQTASRRGIPLHINARVDVFFEPVGEQGERIALTVERATAYIAAGASSIFIPGVRDLRTIRELTAAIDAPVNILAGRGAPSRSELAAAGAGRISTGSSLHLAVMERLQSITGDLIATGSFDQLGGIPYPELNTYFRDRA